MTAQNFANQAQKLAISVLHAYFVEDDMEKVIAGFSHNCSSWIGWGKHEMYWNYDELYQTFASRTGEIYNTMEDIDSCVLYQNDSICVVLVTCYIRSRVEMGYFMDEFGRFTFVIGKDNGEPKIFQLHSSNAWKDLAQNEVYPVVRATDSFRRFEQQLPSDGLAAAAAINTPNGLKCCRIEQNYPAIFINKAFYTMAGYEDMTDMLQHTNGALDKLVYSQDVPKVIQAMQSHMQGQPYTINYRLLRKDNTTLWVLERGQCVHLDDEDYLICSISPLLPDQEEFNYGTLIDYETMDKYKIPVELFLKVALDIVSSEETQTALEKIMQLCTNVLQLSGILVEKLHDDKTATYHIGYCEDGRQHITKPLQVPYTFNSRGVNKCSDTCLLPTEYQHLSADYGIGSFVSKKIESNGREYVATLYNQSPHSWSENELEIICQTGKLLTLLLR